MKDIEVIVREGGSDAEKSGWEGRFWVKVDVPQQ
jgi:hypothetical protein